MQRIAERRQKDQVLRRQKKGIHVHFKVLNIVVMTESRNQNRIPQDGSARKTDGCI